MPLARRRLFSRIGSGLGAALFLPPFRAGAGRVLLAAAKTAEKKKPEDLAGDEAYWSEIARAFDTDRTLVNLNNGGCSPAPAHGLEAQTRGLRVFHRKAGAPMWDVA